MFGQTPLPWPRLGPGTGLGSWNWPRILELASDPGFGLWILDLGSGLWILDLGSGLWILDSDPGFWILEAPVLASYSKLRYSSLHTENRLDRIGHSCKPVDRALVATWDLEPQVIAGQPLYIQVTLILTFKKV